MTARRVIAVLAFTLWLTITGLTIYDIVENGANALAFVSLVFCTILGVGIFGALNERRGGPR